MLKNLGVVKWFGSGDKNYGFITVLSGNDNPADKKDIFFHREGINPASVIYKGERLSVYPHEGDFVSFDIVDTAKGLKAVNVTVLNAQALANETNFADEAGYKDFRRKIMSASSGKKFFDKFIAAVPEENFRKYPWLREELSRQKHVELCLEIYVETPTPELESEMTEILSCIGNEIKFQIPPELAVKKFFREHSDIESKRAALEKYFDTLTVEEIAHLTKKD
ncbi:MAG: cold shock domain-containing protein, partial [Selenomonadaceae bacterium]|nr:cold shock domain-containing protein [Selenomonadaceae bacterium]